MENKWNSSVSSGVKSVVNTHPKATINFDFCAVSWPHFTACQAPCLPGGPRPFFLARPQTHSTNQLAINGRCPLVVVVNKLQEFLYTFSSTFTVTTRSAVKEP